MLYVGFFIFFSRFVLVTVSKTSTPLTSHSQTYVYFLSLSAGRGYRYYTGPVVYPFAYGLSLTNFTFTPIIAAWPSDEEAATALTTVSQAEASAAAGKPLPVLTYAVNVTNTGDVPGDEVAFLFFEPQSLPALASPNRLLRQLLDYQRVHLVPGQSATVTFSVTAVDLAVHERDSGDKVSTPGRFNVVVTNGAGLRMEQPVTISGPQRVLEPFPRL